MKKVFVLLTCFIILVSACGNSNMLSDDNKSNNNYKSNISDEYANSLNLTDIKIYRLTRDACEAFLNEPTYDYLQENYDSEFSYQKDGDVYETCDVTLFNIRNSLVGFLGNNDEIKRFLYNNDLEREIDSVVVFDAPKMPITAWVKTTEDNIFITVNENPEDGLYTYRIYNQSDFKQKYLGKTGVLIINGVEVKTDVQPRIYYKYADVPLIIVLESLGATIENKNSEVIKIDFENKVYYLDINSQNLYEYGNEDVNILHLTAGGPIFIYNIENELMVDSATLSSTLKYIGLTVSVKIDLENNAITLNR